MTKERITYPVISNHIAEQLCLVKAGVDTDKYWFIQGITPSSEKLGVYHGMVVDKEIRGKTPLTECIVEGTHPAVVARIRTEDMRVAKAFAQFCKATFSKK